MQRERLYLKLADRIKDYIREQELQAGDRLPSERELASAFSVSRSSVREAVRRLQDRDILEVEVGSGMFVKTPYSSEKLRIDLWKTDYSEILEIKMQLELYMTQKLCRTITEDQADYLEEALLVMEEDYREGSFSSAHDHVFHDRILELTSNRTMAQMVIRFLDELDAYGDSLKNSDKIWRETVPFHRELLEGLRDHDEERVRRAYGAIWKLDEFVLNQGDDQGRQLTV